MSSLVVIVPGQLNTRTGGYIYDRHVVEGLRARGWRVDVREIDDDFPFPSAGSLERTEALLQSLPDRSLMLIDGLAFGRCPTSSAAKPPSAAGRAGPSSLASRPASIRTAAALGERRRALRAACRVVVTAARPETACHDTTWPPNASRSPNRAPIAHRQRKDPGRGMSRSSAWRPLFHESVTIA